MYLPTCVPAYLCTCLRFHTHQTLQICALGDNKTSEVSQTSEVFTSPEFPAAFFSSAWCCQNPCPN
ncbi:MAG: hypothetical protein COS37_09225 [Anaerolineae bacterium CG03_land_8_20_14_0_80_58_20]|nr:MAG: hypothetical protein COS37_09225 [Anaerolineae bacterium CG03_land_8_20_14_0_80_58_20]